MAVERLSCTEGTILEALASYRFLTPAQLMRLGVTKDKTYLYDTLRTLKKRRPAQVPFASLLHLCTPPQHSDLLLVGHVARPGRGVPAAHPSSPW